MADGQGDGSLFRLTGIPWLDEEWRALAACAGKPPEWWFPASHSPVDPRAHQLCRACPVNPQCLEWAIVNRELGMWADTSERERRKIRKRRGLREWDA